MEALEKKMVQLENELAQTQTNLETATHNLEEKERELQNVITNSEWDRLKAFCILCVLWPDMGKLLKIFVKSIYSFAQV